MPISSLSSAFPVYFTLLLSLVVVGIGFYRGKFLDVAPILSWTLFMQIPFVLQAGYYFPGSALTQAYGIAIFSFAIGAGDFLSLSYRNKAPEQNFIAHLDILLIVSLACLFYFPVYHLLHVSLGSIPLFSALLGDLSYAEVAEKRELFGKHLRVGAIYKYAFQWVCTIFGPLAVGVLFRKKKYIYAMAIFGWVALYVVLSTARLPLLLFCVFSTLSISSGFTAFWRKKIAVITLSLLIGFAFSGAIRVIEISSWLDVNAKSNEFIANYKKNEIAKDPLRQLTINDVERVEGVSIPGIFGEKFNRLIYRAFMSPVDVSNKWYTYFEYRSEDKKGLKDFIENLGSHEMKPSNKVGKWAYVERFPLIIYHPLTHIVL